VYVLQSHLRLRPRHLLPLAVLLVPVTDGLSNAASAYPTWLAMNADIPVWLVWAAGALTITLATLEIHGTVSLLKRLPKVDRAGAGSAVPAARTAG
jgi:hypothetical protein